MSGVHADPSYLADFVYGGTGASVFAIDVRNWLLLAETATVATLPLLDMVIFTSTVPPIRLVL